VRPCHIVVGDPAADELPCLVEDDEQSLIEEFVAHPTVEALDKPVLHRFAGCDVVPVDPMIHCPAEDRIRCELGAVVTDDHSWLSACLDQHSQFAGDPPA